MLKYLGRPVSLLAACMVSFAPMYVSAADVQTAQLRLSGKILPASCELQFPNSNVADYGGISPSILDDSAATFIDYKYVKYNISCGTKTRVAVKFEDGRKGTISEGDRESVPPEQRYGLGLASGKAIGFYYLTPHNDSSISICSSVNEGASWHSGAGSVFDPGEMMSWGGDSCGYGPDALTEVSGSMVVNGYVTSKSNLPIGERVELDGMFTMELIYL